MRGATKSRFETTHMLEGGECGTVRTHRTGPHCVKPEPGPCSRHRTSSSSCCRVCQCPGPRFNPQPPHCCRLTFHLRNPASLFTGTESFHNQNVPGNSSSSATQLFTPRTHTTQRQAREDSWTELTGLSPPKRHAAILKLHMSRSQHLQRSCQRNGRQLPPVTV